DDLESVDVCFAEVNHRGTTLRALVVSERSPDAEQKEATRDALLRPECAEPLVQKRPGSVPQVRPELPVHANDEVAGVQKYLSRMNFRGVDLRVLRRQI